MGDPAIENSLKKLNQDLLGRVEKSGRAFLSNAVIDGKYAMRACIVNFRTSDADIEALPDIVATLGRDCRYGFPKVLMTSSRPAR